MEPRQIDRFFRTLGRELALPAKVILTGAAAGSLWGQVRPSLDIDFAIQPKRGGASEWSRVEAAVERTKQLTGVSANYAIDIDRWGPISLLNYRRHTHPYRSFGQLTVHLLDPVYWTIGKLSRYLAPDIDDLVTVLRRQNLSSPTLLRLWGRAVRESSPSLACTQFCQQVEHFLKTYGRTVWGRTFDDRQAIANFHRHARIHR